MDKAEPAPTDGPQPVTDLDPSRHLNSPPTMAAGPKEETQLITNGHGKNGNGSQKPYPKSVFFIVGNEFCERFSYYGMRAILVIYLTNWLQFSKDDATAIYHGFIVLCYFMPMFGAILADGYLNKYRTILYLSIVYFMGNIIMTFTAFPPPYWVGPIIGLFFIGVGTGGIKPCVSTFGGDQFASDQEKQRSQFFSVFYFAINLGSFLSMVITPLIRENMLCFGGSCYPMAFGLPAILMLIALGLFWFGRNMYRIYPATGSVVKNFFCCIGRALKNRCKPNKEEKEHWLDYADDYYDVSFIEDVRCVLKTFILFIPLPVFWALFDQQGSRWTLQSTQLDRSLGQDWYIPPDQIQAINPILILLLIPVFEAIIYPLLDKCKVPNRPLQRMVAGMLFAAVAFVIAGLLQLKIDNSLWFDKPSSGESSLDFVNLSPCPVDISTSWTNTSLSSTEKSDKYFESSQNHVILITPSDINSSLCQPPSSNLQVNLMSEKTYHVITANNHGILYSKLFEHPIHRAPIGGTYIGFIVAMNLFDPTAKIILQEQASKETYTYIGSDFNITSYQLVIPGSYNIRVEFGNSTVYPITRNFHCLDGTIYTLVIYRPTSTSEQFQISALQECPGNSVSMWFQLPQYIIITIGEVLFAITGLAFSYSQAPESMKSVVQAGWLLTTAFGNLIDVIVAGVRISSQAVEFFFFAILMGLMTAIFAVMAYFYKYIDESYIDLDVQSDVQDLTTSAASMAMEPVQNGDVTTKH